MTSSTPPAGQNQQLVDPEQVRQPRSGSPAEAGSRPGHPQGDPNNVIIDMTHAHVWDASSVAALDAITTKYAARGKTVEIIELNKFSARIHQNLAGQLKVGR